MKIKPINEFFYYVLFVYRANCVKNFKTIPEIRHERTMIKPVIHHRFKKEKLTDTFYFNQKSCSVLLLLHINEYELCDQHVDIFKRIRLILQYMLFFILNSKYKKKNVIFLCLCKKSVI